MIDEVPTMHTCHFCGSETATPRFVYCDGREGVPTCNPPCEAALRPRPVARATKACLACGRDVTNEDTYRGLGFCCLGAQERELIGGDPVVHALRRL